MNKLREKWYLGDSRYEKVLEQMQLLGIQDVTTMRQHKNGTITWKLPIKNYNSGKTNIEVASFKTGYVRNNNSGYSNYQLNKRQFEDEYFQAYEWKTINGDYKQVKIPGQYNKWQRKTCKLIPIEIDRLEYLISYCLKNYYIKNANRIADGNYIPIRMHNHELESQKEKSCDELAEFLNEKNALERADEEMHISDRIRNLESTVNKQAERLHQIYLKARN